MKTPALLAALLMTTSMTDLAPKLKSAFEAKRNGWAGCPTSGFISTNQLSTETSH